MIEFVAGDEMMWKGILYAIGMFLAAELQTFFFHQNLIQGYRIGIKWRSSLMSIIYKKVKVVHLLYYINRDRDCGPLNKAVMAQLNFNYVSSSL